MKTLNLSSKTIILIRVTGATVLLCLILFFVLYFNGWLPSYPKISKDNVSNYLGEDLWSNIIENFDDVEIDNIPLKSQRDSIINYSAVVIININDKSQWLEKSSLISSRISQYLSDNPKCELNDFDSITIEFKYNTDVNSVTFSNKYVIGDRNEKLDGFDCIQISSENESFLSFADVLYFNSAKYLIVNVPIDDSTDFSVLEKLNSINELNLFVDDSYKQNVKEQIDIMQLPYMINVY